MLLTSVLLSAALFGHALASIQPLALSRRQTADTNLTVQLIITNLCSSSIWPGIQTDAGHGPSTNGFQLSPSTSQNLSVSTDWTGRVWGRTNCTFNSTGSGSCMTGDCGGQLNCSIAGAAATLAEFNLPGYDNLSFYDISLVDGYNLPLAIQALLNASNPGGPPANETNPACVASVWDMAPQSFDPYAGGSPAQLFLNTNASYPLPFDVSLSAQDVSTWCPYDLQTNPLKDGDGKPCPCFVGADVAHPPFNPCLSACSKYGKAQFCCTGKHGSSKKCAPNYYSRRAKTVCPDAYSYAFDDATSTFTVPMGTGFEVVFCPGGRSTTILQTLAGQGRATSVASGLVVNVKGVLAAVLGTAVVVGLW